VKKLLKSSTFANVIVKQEK